MFGQPDIDECITIAQFNELRQSMEERQDMLTQDFQALMAKIRRHRQPHDGASNYGDHEESEGAAARRRREQWRRNQHAAHDRRRGRGRTIVMNLKMVMMVAIYKILLVADHIEEATKKRSLVN